MPTVLRIGPFRFFFYSADGHESPHIHVSGGRGKAKFWLQPIAYSSSSGFSGRELQEIQRLIADHQRLCLDKWHEYFEH